ncbi:hypothetical protein [Geoalkalibacter halelectricus]|uniref:TraB family protein n=1 Tax=Geoalkalibacter halelectricus TaxID=2847045 RepID=A0ABY5ZG39_9BACT|nr:hypothetical protein [Geoalkalibacter halelectricus]MDO3378190.1 hypothetical protein [Geoalkalibacter halelectricus]UWZ78033.1 hypothetical protein L9S41_10010 [Geoalkalibacter halelectricus]
MFSSLVLLGTVHRDPHSVPCLRRLLEQLGPALVSLEMSPWARDFRLERGPALQRRLHDILKSLAEERGLDPAEIARHPAIREIRALLALPYEYRAAAAYCAARGVPLHLIDDNAVSQEKLALVEYELVSIANLRTLLSLPEPPANRENHATARRLLADDCPIEIRQAFLAARRGEHGIGPRDRRMARQIRKLGQEARPERLVHIGGWVHLVDDAKGETLYSLLADLKPERRLLV